jgi:hypothetical protein
MKRASWLLSLAACAAAGVIACSKTSSSPAAPGPIDPAMITANADGSTLKVSAPTQQSPANGAKLEQGNPVVLVVSNSTAAYANPVPLSYRFELTGPNGVVENTLVASGASTTSRTLDATQLEGEKTYSWRSRAEYQGTPGPWSGTRTFIAPQSTGYIRGNEIYDPLIDGKTVGTIHGPVTFIPGVGVRLDAEESWIEYALPQTLTEGEYSVLATGLVNISNTEDPKLRVISMREGSAPMNDNIYRMTIDKRGNGAIAWRFLSGNNSSGAYIETVGSERTTYRFRGDLTYLVKGTWRGGFFSATYKEGGADGTTIYEFGKPYTGVYQPFPQMVYIGSPYEPGDRGEPSSLDGMIVRQLWLSPNPRPAFANK